MPDDEASFRLAGQKVVALAERALLWPDKKTLFVADVHFGKDAAFRHARRWVPPGTTGDDLSRLTRLIDRYRVKRLIILGDAFHSEHAEERATFEEIRAWRDGVPCAVQMVKGNHDRRATGLAERLDFDLLEEGQVLGPWSLRHHPAAEAGGYVLCGHIHPVARVYGPARQSERVPCFWADGRQCILPAFGGFTGGAVVRPRRGDQVILVVGTRVIASAK